MADSLIKLTNPPFNIEYKEKNYEVRKASLTKIVLYNARVQELAEKGVKNSDPELLGYAFFLILKEAIPDLTEEDVMQNVPGDTEVVDTLIHLGFVNPTKAKTLLKLMMQAKAEAMKEPTSPDFSAPSATEPAGPQA